MVTLFTLMVVNNWMVQVSQFIFVMAKDGVNENLVRVYFILFFYFSVVIGINLVVAYVLDMYDSIERLNNDRKKTLELMNEQMNNAAAMDAEDGAKHIEGLKDKIGMIAQAVDEKVKERPQLISRKDSIFFKEKKK